MDSYGPLADYYDRLTRDVNYCQWATYIEKMFVTHSISGKLVLDLACGTGSLTFALADLGYEMIGVDSSPDMLAQATVKSYGFDGAKPLFLNQTMENLDLYGTIHGCVCCLDSVNYVTQSETLLQAFQRVHLFLEPDGKFLFDIKAPHSLFMKQDTISLDEREDIFCVWRSESSKDTMHTTHHFTLFHKEGIHWIREEETHTQKIYQPEEITTMLERVGFENIQQFGNLSFEPPTPEDDRIFFFAEKNRA